MGGGAVHWNGQTWRFQPEWFRLRSWVNERYGEDFLGPEVTIQDWGVSYDELERYYMHFEKVMGIGGLPAMVNGRRIEGGNPFEGPRSEPYPQPPMKKSHSGFLFEQAASSLGYHPFPVPLANSTGHYVNPFGAELMPCMYCGFCERFGCEHFAKASPQVNILPFALANRNFELRTRAYVQRIEWDRTARRATGVTYVDAQGQENLQPAEMVVLCAFAHHNPILMLQSGIGQPYNPETRTGTVGRNYTYQTMTGVSVFYEGQKRINPFMVRARWVRLLMISTTAASITRGLALSAAPMLPPIRPTDVRSTYTRCRKARPAGVWNGSRPWLATTTARFRSPFTVHRFRIPTITLASTIPILTISASRLA